MYPYNPFMGQLIRSKISGDPQDHAFIAHVQYSALEAVAADIDGVHSAIALDVAGKDVTTGISNPVVPRNLSITGTKAGESLTGDVVITGTNALDEVISETIALNGDTTVEGAYAFKTITKISVPARVTEGDTVKIGWADKLGNKYLLTHNTVLMAFLNNTKEGTAPTVVCDSDEIEKNTIDLNSALDGHVVDVYMMV